MIIMIMIIIFILIIIIIIIINVFSAINCCLHSPRTGVTLGSEVIIIIISCCFKLITIPYMYHTQKQRKIKKLVCIHIVKCKLLLTKEIINMHSHVDSCINYAE